MAQPGREEQVRLGAIRAAGPARATWQLLNRSRIRDPVSGPTSLSPGRCTEIPQRPLSARTADSPKAARRAGARVPVALALPAVPEASGFCSSLPGSTSSRPQRPEPQPRAPQAQRPDSPLPALPPGLSLARVTGVQFRVFSTPSKERLRDLSATRPGARTSPGISSEHPRARLRLALHLDLVGNTLTRLLPFPASPDVCSLVFSVRCTLHRRGN